jgi:hypothetical protein
MQWPPTCGRSGTRMGMGGDSPAGDCSTGQVKPQGAGIDRSLRKRQGMAERSVGAMVLSIFP